MEGLDVDLRVPEEGTLEVLKKETAALRGCRCMIIYDGLPGAGRRYLAAAVFLQKKLQMQVSMAAQIESQKTDEVSYIISLYISFRMTIKTITMMI